MSGTLIFRSFVSIRGPLAARGAWVRPHAVQRTSRAANGIPAGAYASHAARSTIHSNAWKPFASDTVAGTLSQVRNKGTHVPRDAVSSFPATVKLPSGGGGGSSSFRTFAKVLGIGVGLLLLPLVATGVGMVALRKLHRCEWSTLFLGEPRSFDAQRSEELGIDLEFLMPKMTEGLLALVFGRPLKKAGGETVVEKKVRKAFQAIVEKYPNHFIGYALLAWLERSKCDFAEMNRLLSQAHAVAEEYPEHNAGLIHLLPSTADFSKLSVSDEEKASLANIDEVADNVWAVGALFSVEKSEPVKDSLWIQATVVKQDNGDVAIINPTHFSPATVEFIEAIGPVKTLVTTSLGHGDALAICKESIWPEAQVVGTSRAQKHGNPQLPWDAFLTKDGVVTDNGQPLELSSLLNDEFEYQMLEGSIFEEAALYHKPSSTLTGITDMLISTEVPADRPKASWGFLAYAFALGFDRGEKTTTLLPQSYHLLFTSNRFLLSECIEKMHSRFRPEHLVLGHGGVLHGRNLCEYELRKGFKWAHALSSKTTKDKLDLIYMPITWLSNSRLALFFVRVFGAVAALEENRRQATK